MVEILMDLVDLNKTQVAPTLAGISRDPYGSRGSKLMIMLIKCLLMECRDPYGSRGSKSFIFGLTVSGLIVEILMDLVDLNAF